MYAQTVYQKQPSKKSTDDRIEMLKFRFRLDNDPHDKTAHEGLIKLLRAKNAFRAELEEDGAWLKNNPNDWEAEIEVDSLANAALDDPEFAFGIDRFILAHTKREDDDHSYDFVESRYAFALLGRKHIEEALVLLRKETVENPEDPAVWQNLGDALVRANQPEQAIPAYEESIALGATQEWPHEGLAKAYFKLKQYSDAETELKAAIALYGAQYHSGEPTDSFHQMMKQIQEATHQEPSLAKLHSQLAQVYVGAKEYAKAISELDSAERANSANKINYEYFRAHIYEVSGQLDKANALRLQASKEVRDEMKKAPKDADMEAYLAYPESLFISFEDDDLSSAQEIIAFYAPLPAAFLKAMDMLTLGMAYCTVGRADQCSNYVESAFRIGGKLNRAESHHKIAEALSDAHDSQGALKHFQAAYELDPINTTYRLDYEGAKSDAASDH
jgi:tetratricopeptide (TPR) repeat protein